MTSILHLRSPLASKLSKKNRVVPRPRHRRTSKLRGNTMTTATEYYGKFVALDCEMVGVGPAGKRSVLARVSAVGWDGCVLFDTFVRVHEKVTDYRTFVSGIQPGDLSGPKALDFGVCRSMVQSMICNKILVGHGLYNDLQVLKLNHPWHLIRDTSLYEPFMRVDYCTGVLCSQKLRTLTYQYLGRTIQEEGSCHNSCEDAWAALELYFLVQNEWEEWWRAQGVHSCHFR